MNWSKRLARTTALVLSLAGLASAATAETPRDTFVMAMAFDAINTLDPSKLGEAIGDEVINNICDSLVLLDTSDDSKLVPGLAESWSVSADGLTLTFKLKAGLKHPSGNAVTAKDAVWSFHRIHKINTINAGTMREWGLGQDRADRAFEAPDDRTLIIRFDKPYPPSVVIPTLFATRVGFILDQAEIMKNARGDDWGQAWLNNNSACIGAYRLQSWIPNDGITLLRNDNYWQGAPAMRRVLIRHIPEAAAQLLQLKAGDVDAARNLNAEGLEAASKDSSLRLLQALRQTLHYMTFNLRDPILADARVRLAFRHLVDYDGLAKTVMRFEGVPRASLVPLGAFGALDEKEGQPFKLDLVKAKELITAAGYPNGFKKEMLMPPNFPNPEVAQHIQANAAKIGIDLQIGNMPGAQLFPKMRVRSFEIGMLNWNVLVADAHAFVSRHAMNPDNSPDLPPSNMATWWSAYFDESINKLGNDALFEKDEGKRAAIYRDIQRRILQEGPSAFMFQIKRNIGVRNAVKDFKFTGNRAHYRTVTKG
jgi:peptide/nickel transport system substrate-binding protein